MPIDTPTDIGAPLLTVLDGPHRGQSVLLSTGKTIVGREQDCRIQLHDLQVSRHHCVFLRDDYAVRLRDLGSRNGTFINGLRSRGEQIVRPGDVITLGQIRLQFTTASPGTAEDTMAISDQTIFGVQSAAGRKSRILM